MVRTKSFSETDVLRSVAILFWRRGYAKTSMDEICDLVSLKKTSIYNAFGNKQALFKKAVEWYYSDLIARALSIAKGQDRPSVEMAAVLEHFLIEADPEVVLRGCFLTNSVLELADTEPDLFAHVSALTDSLEQAIEMYLRQAHAAGKIQPSADPVSLASIMMTMLHGLRVQSRLGADRSVIEASIGSLRQSFAALEIPP